MNPLKWNNPPCIGFHLWLPFALCNCQISPHDENTLALGYVIHAIRAYSRLPPLRQCPHAEHAPKKSRRLLCGFWLCVIRSSIAHVGYCTQKGCVFRLVGRRVAEKELHHFAAGLLRFTLLTENVFYLCHQHVFLHGWRERSVIICHRRILGFTLPFNATFPLLLCTGKIFFFFWLFGFYGHYLLVIGQFTVG